MTRTMYDREHERELRKHDPRPTDGARNLPAPSLLAIETALLVRNQGIKLTLAAQLIEEYARAERARISLEAVAAGALP